jgi:hypothetical protein
MWKIIDNRCPILKICTSHIELSTFNFFNKHLQTIILNTNLTNYGQNAYFWTFFETMRVLAISAIHRYPKFFI